MNYREVAQVQFPEFSGLNVNMMPFVMGDANSIPEPLLGYRSLIEACDLPAHEIGAVGYLTIDERFVEHGSHRRGGVHTEGFGNVDWGRGTGSWGGFPQPTITGSWGGWGGIDGGLYMANNQEATCSLYDTFVSDSGPGGEVDPRDLGGVEPILMPADTLYWLHDRTPHESLPTQGERQFFRLVTSNVSVWYVDHSSANPLGVEPSGRKIYGSKFA